MDLFDHSDLILFFLRVGLLLFCLASECRSYIIIEVSKWTRWQNQVACFCSQLTIFFNIEKYLLKRKRWICDKNYYRSLDGKCLSTLPPTSRFFPLVLSECWEAQWDLSNYYAENTVSQNKWPLVSLFFS